ncbi:MAG: hypothetical protein PHO94_14250 [Petrimonas sp.]|nr:hypothetical protein [Petrimonas sp.]
MDLRTRKLNVIEYLIGLDDEEVFSKIEATIFENKKQLKKFRPFTRQDLIARANRSNEDYEAGRIITQEDLEVESENW